MSYENETLLNQENTIYVGNLHENVSKEILYELFVQFTLIRNMRFPIDHLTGKHKGYCLIELYSPLDVEFVTELVQSCKGQLKLFSNSLVVRKSVQSTSDIQEYPVPAILSVHNLIENDSILDQSDVSLTAQNDAEDDSIDDDPAYIKKCLKQVKSIFKQFGELVHDPIVMSASSSNGAFPKRYINVQYKKFEQADKALNAMNGTLILNKHIQVVYALKDPQNSKSNARHGDEIERYLENQAMENNILH
ncbi:hypothetical protein ACO0RG_003479 [Hanseniaspora osmophila]|uniref:Protein HSH49 n=1 Tax=Hanseniaspora osmophila TaxID=56408 RepID=A0A1E5REQ3_9ASCO|nr:Protein HSH49 [Hanseniaspora osmophila]